MGVRNYWIDGVSGAGKTTVAEELERRGHRVVHGDRALARYGDPDTGAPLDGAALRRARDDCAWGYRRWIWPVERVKALIADESAAMTFFCGGARNGRQFIALFDAVFVLEVDPGTLKRRLAGRGDDEFGGRPDELELVVRLHASGEGLPAAGIGIDAMRPVAQVVDEIVARCADRAARSPGR